MPSAYNQDALAASAGQVQESSVSFDVNAEHQFKKMTGDTSQGWVTMASVAKPSDVDVKSFATRQLALEPGDEAQDNNPFYCSAINRNGTIVSNVELEPTEDFEANYRQTQGFG